VVFLDLFYKLDYTLKGSWDSLIFHPSVMYKYFLASSFHLYQFGHIPPLPWRKASLLQHFYSIDMLFSQSQEFRSIKQK